MQLEAKALFWQNLTNENKTRAQRTDQYLGKKAKTNTKKAKQMALKFFLANKSPLKILQRLIKGLFNALFKAG